MTEEQFGKIQREEAIRQQVLLNKIGVSKYFDKMGLLTMKAAFWELLVLIPENLIFENYIFLRLTL